MEKSGAEIVVTEDHVSINSGGFLRLTLSALGGPEDDIRVVCTSCDFQMNRDSLDLLQTSIINFMNTGYFNQEA